MGELTVRLVATDREVYTGKASTVVFETPDGQMGIMSGHAPVMAILRDIVRDDQVMLGIDGDLHVVTDHPGAATAGRHGAGVRIGQ